MQILGSVIRQTLGEEVLPWVEAQAGFKLARISLLRLACPVQLESLLCNTAQNTPLVIVKNKKAQGSAPLGFTPKALVLSGAATRNRFMVDGRAFAYAWVEAGIDIDADDAMGCSDLMSQAQELVHTKLYGASSPNVGQPWAGIREVYPFENYFIFDFRGSSYRQHYDLDSGKRNMRLVGPEKAVTQKFVDAVGQFQLPRAQTGMRYTNGAVPPAFDQATSGGRSSELVTNLVRSWTNIQQAADAYVQATKTGLYKPMKPAFYPVLITDDGRVGAVLKACKCDQFEFARYTALVREKKISAKAPMTVTSPTAGASTASAKAYRFADKATMSSRVAQTGNTPELHQRAADFHKHAATAHNQAADQFGKLKNYAAAQSHKQQSQFHDQAYKTHMQAVMSGQPAKIKAGGPGSGPHPSEAAKKAVVRSGKSVFIKLPTSDPKHPAASTPEAWDKHTNSGHLYKGTYFTPGNNVAHRYSPK